METNKNLPIKFFQKRQKDERGTEGGGDNSIPRWVDQSTIGQKSIYIREVLNVVSESLSRKISRNNYIPSVVKLKIKKDALAKTYRREINHLFDVGKLNIIGVEEDDEVLVKIDNQDDLNKIIKKIERLQDAVPTYSNIVGISSIEDIKEFKPKISIEAGEAEILKIKLFNYGNSDLNVILIKEFEKYCAEKNFKFKKASYSGDLNIYRVSGLTKDSLYELQNFEGIQGISEMPTYEVNISENVENNDFPIKYPEQGKEYPIVGVLDTGIASIPHLAPWIHQNNITYYPDAYVNKSHGTFVAGVLLYGDELENKAYTGFEGCKLFEVIVMPDLQKQKLDESELIEQIRDAISRNANIKIWNLSLGTKYEADLYEFSDFAKALDSIQEEYHVLICKSAGNCYNFIKNAPRGRITRSADTVRGIVIGSLAHDKNSTDHAEKNHASPFSRKGPGPSYLIKPDLVHFGGNAGLDSNSDIAINPVKSFSVDGSIAKEVGTSFSTPRITAIVAGLDFILNEDFNPVLLKALIIHSAKYPQEMKMSISEKMHSVGFGLPSNIQDILYNEPHEITLILQDTLEKGTFIDILDFPFPKSMIDENGYYYGEVTVTLVAAPILESSQGAEYCQSNISIMLGSYDEKIERNTSKITNLIGASERKNLLSSDLYSKKANKDFETSFSTERMLVAYGDKFQPVKKWSVNFDEFTDSNKEKYLKAPKNWYLKLEGLYRHYTETKCDMHNVTPSQEFSLLITIRDTKKKGNIYNEVTQMLDTYSFVHSNVKIKEEVRVQINNNNNNN